MSINLEKLSYQINKSIILDQIDHVFNAQQTSVILGLNGAGKSTLLKLILGQHKPSQGRLFIHAHNTHTLTPPQRAQLITSVLQQEQNGFDGTVLNMVLCGRFRFFKTPLMKPEKKDVDIALTMLSQVNLALHHARFFNTLSGGEKQRVRIARALAQETPYLLLDEPTDGLDLAQRMHLADIIRKLCETYKKTVILTTHDLYFAKHTAHQINVLHQQKLLHLGSPEPTNKQLINTLSQIFGRAIILTKDNQQNTHWVIE